MLVVSPPQFALVAALMPAIARCFAENCGRALFDALLSQLASYIAGSPKFEAIRAVFVQRIFPIVFQPLSSPAFAELALAIGPVTQMVKPPNRAYAEFAEGLLADAHPKSAVYYRDYVKWLLDGETDGDRVTNVVLEVMPVLQRRFQAMPSVEHAECIVEALRIPSRGFDAAFILLGKLAMLQVPTVFVFAMVHAYVRKSGEKEVEACRNWLDSLAESYQCREMVDGIRLILDGKPREALELIL
jgi:hypothetical protein